MNRPNLHFVVPAILLALFAASLSHASAEPGAVRFEQKIGNQLPLDLVLTDDAGQTVALSRYFGKKPVVIVFGYWHCAQLCSVVADSVVATLRQIRPRPENRFALLYVSIDPTDTVADARQAREHALRALARPTEAADWHFLTGPEAALRPLARAAGFNYFYDAPTRQYAHPSGFLIASPAGTISRYFLGLDFAPAEVDRALLEASAGKSGPTTFDLLVLCFRGEGFAGRYGPVIWRVLEVAVVGTVLMIALGIGWMIFRERQKQKPNPVS